MASCPSCEAPDLEVDEYDLEEGEIVTCPDCGASLEVTGIAPLELEVLSADDDDDDDEDEDEEEDDEDDEDGDERDEEEEREDWD